MTDSIVAFGTGLEKALLRFLSKNGLRVFGQDLENYSEADGFFLEEDGVDPGQVKAMSPRACRKDVGFKYLQWKRYKKFAEKFNKFTCYVVTTTFNPALDFDYCLYEFDIKTMDKVFIDNDFVYIKLDQMKKSKLKLPEEFQRVIENEHKRLVRPTMDKKSLGGYKDKF